MKALDYCAIMAFTLIVRYWRWRTGRPTFVSVFAPNPLADSPTPKRPHGPKPESRAS